MRKEALSVLLIFSLLIGCTIVKANQIANGFSDISRHWAKSSIETAVQKGYVAGYADGTFKPDKNVTRVEFISMVVRALKLPVAEKKAGQAWYTPYVNEAVNAGIHKYSDFKTGTPDTPLTRMEMARIAVRAAVKEAQKVTDDKEFMYHATKTGLIHGLSGGELGVDKTSTRAQSVAIIERILSLKNGEKLPVDKDAISYAEVDYKGTNVESMFEQYGIKAKKFPVSINLGKNIETTVDKMIVVDMDRKDGAFRSWFPAIRKEDDKPLGSEYVFAFHFKATNKVARKSGYINIPSALLNTGVSRGAGIPPEYYDQTPIRGLKVLFLKKVGTIEGWYLVAYPKSFFEYAKQWTAISFYNQVTGEEVYFNVIPKQ